ncbi:MAG TPA: sugar transferase [Oligoflexia bacterium]|nr:sugar transferase [Oligoflexia bacterium]HMP48690.1 sugar transferase [Oligoflexia bacterium]
MLKSYWRIISWLERLSDNILVVISFFLAYGLRDGFLGTFLEDILFTNKEFLELGEIEQYYLVLAVSLPTYNACLSLLGAYRSMRFHVWTKLLRICVISASVVFLTLAAFLFLLKIDLSRSFIAIFCLISCISLFFERFLVLAILRFFRMRGKNFRNILIVGTGVQARKLFFEIQSQPELGIRVQGFVDVRGASNKAGDMVPEDNSSVYDLPSRVISTAETFETALKRYAIDEVLFTEVISTFPIVHSLSEIAVDEGVRVTFAADLFSLGIFTSEVSSFGDIPVIHFHAVPGGDDNIPLAIKRLIDIFISALLLVLLFPLFIFIAISIKIDSSGPVFFTQRRVGLNGRIFTLYKFRSMITGAERILDDLREQNEMKGPVFKMRSDPRITKMGKFLRKYSLDELPQLWNVLKGDMSLVGPRPPLPEEVTHYKRKQRKRLSMRPGLTCTWQVNGRNEIPDFEEWAKLDLEYINNWSLTRDISLLIKTIPVVLSGVGAR